MSGVFNDRESEYHAKIGLSKQLAAMPTNAQFFTVKSSNKAGDSIEGMEFVRTGVVKAPDRFRQERFHGLKFFSTGSD